MLELSRFLLGLPVGFSFKAALDLDLSLSSLSIPSLLLSLLLLDLSVISSFEPFLLELEPPFDEEDTLFRRDLCFFELLEEPDDDWRALGSFKVFGILYGICGEVGLKPALNAGLLKFGL